MADFGSRRRGSRQNRVAIRAWVALGTSALLIVAGILFLVGAATFEEIRSSVGQAAAEVGLSAKVSPNEWNTIALQLEEKDSRLQGRAAELDERERALNASRTSELKLAPWFIVSGLALFGLVLLNFYLDYRRRTITPVR